MLESNSPGTIPMLQTFPVNGFAFDPSYDIWPYLCLFKFWKNNTKYSNFIIKIINKIAEQDSNKKTHFIKAVMSHNHIATSMLLPRIKI